MRDRKRAATCVGVAAARDKENWPFDRKDLKRSTRWEIAFYLIMDGKSSRRYAAAF